MPAEDAELDDLIQLILDQPDWEGVRQVLTDHADYLGDAFFDNLYEIARGILGDGDLEGAASASAVGEIAAELVDSPLHLAQFLHLEAVAAERAGEIDDAARLYHVAAEEADGEATADNALAIWMFVAAGTDFVELALEWQNYAAARQMLLYMRQRCHQLQSLSGELTATLNLASLHFQQKEPKEARGYALLAVELFGQLQEGEEYSPPPPNRDAAVNILFNLASDFYYELEDFEGAAELAQHAIELGPQQEGGYYILGISQFQLQEHEAALATWERAIDLNPTRPFYFANYAGALIQAGRQEEAVAAMGKAIELRPDDITYYMNRGQLYQGLGQHRAAIADFDQAIALAEAAAAQETTPAAPPRSQFEYDREMPTRDRLDFAMMYRIQSLVALGERDEALQSIAYLIETGDDPTRAAAYMLQGDLFKADQQPAEALTAYDTALDILPGLTGARTARAELYLSLDDGDRALRDLAFLAQREQTPEVAIEQLTKLIEQDPDNLALYKWRGYAYWESWYPSRAIADLDRYLEGERSDAEAFLWRGLAAIAYSPHPEEEAWNESFDLRRVVEALGDLAMAVRLAPGNEQTLAAYKWLVDRAATDDLMLEWLMGTGETEVGLFQIIPEAREPLNQYWVAADYSRKRDWRQAVATLKAAQVGLEEAGLPVLASHLHLFIADNYLRLYELQRALDHLDELEQGYYLRGTPLTAHLRPAVDERSAERQERFGTGAVGLEIDYLNVYSLGFWTEQFWRDLLRAQAYSRIGNHEQALAALAEHAEQLENVETALEQGISFRAFIQIVQVLRDAKEFEQAITLLQKLEPLVGDDAERGIDFYATTGTIMQLAGNHDDAEAHFQQAMEIAREREGEVPLASALQLAGNYYYAGEPGESLALLEKIDIDSAAGSENHSYYYYLTRSQALQALGRDAEALQAILQALAIAENTRGELMRFDARMSWQARQEWLYQTGVLLAVKQEDYQAAVHLGERARARAFIDQLATASLPLPEAGRQLAVHAQNLQELRSLLLQLRESAAAGFLDLETVARLGELDSGIAVLEETDEGVPRLAPDKVAEELNGVERQLARVQAEIEEAQLASETVSSQTVSAYAGLQELLVAQGEG